LENTAAKDLTEIQIYLKMVRDQWWMCNWKEETQLDLQVLIKSVKLIMMISHPTY
jgi:hypothetical protein